LPSATKNTGLAVEPEERGQLAHERLQSASPVRAKMRKRTIISDGTPGLLCLSSPGRCQRLFCYFLGTFA
jgi:hypothetical protein